MSDENNFSLWATMFGALLSWMGLNAKWTHSKVSKSDFQIFRQETREDIKSMHRDVKEDIKGIHSRLDYFAETERRKRPRE